jgi:hypothetical protein
MFARRHLLLSLLAIPLPLATAAAADPWWDERARQAEWERERDIERRRAAARHQRWDEAKAHAAWERQARATAKRDWDRSHHR